MRTAAWRNLEFCAVACLRLRCGASFSGRWMWARWNGSPGLGGRARAPPDMWRQTASGGGAALSAMGPECICWPRSANGCKVSSGNCGWRRRPTRSRRLCPCSRRFPSGVRSSAAMRSSPKPTSVASSSSAAAITSSRSRATSRRWKPTSPWPSGRIPPSAEGRPAPDVARVETVEKGHGRIEIRRLECSESLASYLSQWPGLRQVCRIERRRSLPGKDSIEVVHAITSLSRERADAASLLNIARGHWGIENRLHHVRDRTCREDACRTRSGNAPQTLAALRNAALTIHRRRGDRPVEGQEHFAEHRYEALAVLKQTRTEWPWRGASTTVAISRDLGIPPPP